MLSFPILIADVFSHIFVYFLMSLFLHIYIKQFEIYFGKLWE